MHVTCIIRVSAINLIDWMQTSTYELCNGLRARIMQNSNTSVIANNNVMYVIIFDGTSYFGGDQFSNI